MFLLAIGDMVPGALAGSSIGNKKLYNFVVICLFLLNLIKTVLNWHLYSSELALASHKTLSLNNTFKSLLWEFKIK